MGTIPAQRRGGASPHGDNWADGGRCKTAARAFGGTNPSRRGISLIEQVGSCKSRTWAGWALARRAFSDLALARAPIELTKEPSSVRRDGLPEISGAVR